MVALKGLVQPAAETRSFAGDTGLLTGFNNHTRLETWKKRMCLWTWCLHITN